MLDLPESGEADLGGMVEDLAGQVAAQAETSAVDQATDWIDNASSLAALTPNDVLGDVENLTTPNFDAFCGPLAVVAPRVTPPDMDCGQTLGANGNGATFGPDSKAFASADDSSGDADQEAACPELAADPPPKVFVICVSLYVAGSLNTGSKDIVLLPGGAIFALTIGSSLAAPTTPSIQTSGSIVLLGGAIGGANLSIQAKDVAVAGADISMTGSLTIKASGSLGVGQVDVQQLLGYIPPLTGWDSHGINLLLGKIKGNLTLGAQLWASHLTLDSGALTIASGSVVSADGLGGGYEPTPPTTKAIGPGGAGWYGGSHIGYGGYGQDMSTIDRITWPAQRQTTYDSPFDPSEPGNGGDGNPDGEDGGGNPGGGVISISSTALILDGTIRSNGDGLAVATSGGAGAGGAIEVKTGALSGNGSVEADGGDVIDDDPSDCPTDYQGGQGAGGAVALYYTSDPGFKAALSAHGGLTDDLPCAPYRDIGGAGTVFLEQDASAPSAPSAPKADSGSSSDDGSSEGVSATDNGVRARIGIDADSDRLAPAAAASAAGGPAGGTLIIDGGVDYPYPAVEPTPLPASWSASDRDLVVSGGARVNATSPSFDTITVTSYGYLTAPATLKVLTVKATSIDVEPTGRIDMTGRGYEGPPLGSSAPYSAQTAPGAVASEYADGSHGGAGGLGPSSSLGKDGSTYDVGKDPTLPGGGGGGLGCVTNGTYPFANPTEIGGGVLYVTATTLDDPGVIAADGQDSDGPVATDPFIGNFDCGGAGAGGSVQVRVQTLSGDGSVQADGGDVCLGLEELLDSRANDDISPCESDDDGAGGGGDVLVVAPDHSSFHGQVTAGGGVNYIDRGADGQPGHAIAP